MLPRWNVKVIRALVFSAIFAAGAQVIPATSSAQTQPAAAARAFNAGTSIPDATQSLIAPLATGTLACGVQWRATIPAHSSQLWFTFNWNPKKYVSWTIMDNSQPDGGPSLTMSNVAVDRNTGSTLTYWLTVVNTSGNAKAFEGRYCYMK